MHAYMIQLFACTHTQHKPCLNLDMLKQCTNTFLNLHTHNYATYTLSNTIFNHLRSSKVPILQNPESPSFNDLMFFSSK